MWLQVSTEEFNLVYERSKTAFPETPIVWLKELTQYLNQKLPLEIQDPVFSNKPPGYPLSVVSALHIYLFSRFKCDFI